MKNRNKAALTLSGLFLTCTAALAGGVEMPPPASWDFYIGGSGVAYNYEYRLNSGTLINPAAPVATATTNPSILLQPANFPVYRSVNVLGGFDIGIGVWGDRGYFGIEGRYDIGRLAAENAALVVNNSPVNPTILTYQALFYNNGFVLAKLGYQLLPRVMPYILLGWARTTYKFSTRIFGRDVTIADGSGGTSAQPTRTVQQFVSGAYKKTLNGGMVGFGTSYLLVDGLSAFAEVGLMAYHFPKEARRFVMLGTNITALPTVTTLTAQTNVVNFNYYAYNVRIGLNWSFASLL